MVVCYHRESKEIAKANFVYLRDEQKMAVDEWKAFLAEGKSRAFSSQSINTRSAVKVTTFHNPIDLQRGPKVTSLIARSSRGRCAQHLHDTRAT
jgi:hypothetical protein